MLDPLTIGDLPLFRGMEQRALETLARYGIEKTFVSGEVLFRAGDVPWGLYVILEGRVRVLRGDGTRNVVVHTEKAGGTLAEVPLFAGGAVPATAVAAEATRCAVFARDALRAAIAANPEVAFALLARLADRVRTLVERLDLLSSGTVSARVADYLMKRHTDTGASSFALGMTQGQLAEELGTVREVIVRELRAFREAGLVRSLAGGRIELLNVDALREHGLRDDT